MKLIKDKKTNKPTKRFFAIIIISIVIIESLIMILFSYIHPPQFVELFGDSILLSALLSPILFLFSYRPMIKEHSKTIEAEQKLQEFNANLEKRIAERTSALANLNKQMQIQTAALQAAANGILITDKNGIIVWVNDAFTQLTGYTATEAIGKNPRLLKSGQQPQKYYEDLWKTILSGQVWRDEIINRRKNGSLYPAEIAIMSVKNVDNEISHFIAITQDVTDRNKNIEALKQSEERLFQSQKMSAVGQLAGGIAHDLNNQLTPVRGYLDLLLQQADPGHSNYQMLTEASQAAQRCTEVIQRLTQFSRPTTQKKTGILLSEMFREFRSVIEKFLPSTIQVGFHCENDIWPIEANETEIQTVLMNLCVNARDAMPQGGRLTIEARNIDLSGKPAVLISITDTGSGMSSDVVKQIFEPFFTTKEKGKGTGLGLAMVFKIIQAYQGWIDVSSKVGQGTAFQIYLPAKPDIAVSLAKVQTGIPNHLLAKNETILLADDEEMVRNLGKVLLERLGYNVHVAHDGEEVVRLYRENPETIDIVMLDMTMPKMTGVQMIQKILEINSKAKIIAASGYTAEGTSQEIIQQGAADFIQKPYTIITLAQILRKVIDAK